MDPASASAPDSGPEAVTSSAPLEPGLYLVGTPIGNMEDITLRALRTLREATHILAEDTRHTRRLLNRHGISTRMISYHKFNERARADEIIGRIQAGEALALVTDAGMPGISDPGARAADAVRDAGLLVTVIPGPCALSAAVALCGQTDGRGFLFEGFLDHKTAARRRRLLALADFPSPVVFYESTHRILKLLAEVEEELGADRQLFIGRELTKKFEESICGTSAELQKHYATHSFKGEFVVILLPA